MGWTEKRCRVRWSVGRVGRFVRSDGNCGGYAQRNRGYVEYNCCRDSDSFNSVPNW
ncbi:hypothetical protein BKA69DRAFT_1043820 [Paraphysoderma sedebokerense]|nr:hypothetical protein BKA69DRAFT_1043820 [Paraphysoderma sedebokerense]